MRIFTASLGTETNTFSPIATGWSAFQELGIYHYGEPLEPSFAASVIPLWLGIGAKDGHEVVHSLGAFAAPAGRTVRAVYESMRDEILHDATERGPFDVALLSMHGAMVADGYDDCEGDLLTRLRVILGSKATIGVELDLHCHMTRTMLDAADIIVTYKEYPHTDIADQGREVYRLALDAAEGRTRPKMGLYDCRMVNAYFTTAEPMRSFIDGLKAREGRDGVLSLSIAHGFPWGDVADNGTRVLAIVDGDQEKADRLAGELGRKLWELRDDISFRGLMIDEALDRALAVKSGLVVIADTADNTGGGAPGDSTFLLRRVRERGIKDVGIAPLWDPIAVQFCRDAGVGATLDLRVGGKCGPSSGDPVDMTVTVRGLSDNLEQQMMGPVPLPVGASAWVEADGVHVVLCSLRVQGYSPEVFTGIGLKLDRLKIAVIKSTNHFRAGFDPVAKHIFYVKGPGAITGEFERIPYQRRNLNYWPRVANPFA
jgi:microcystin degradation protein MlrC